MTWWNEYRCFNEYFDRLGYLVANSRDIVNAVVINPMASVYLDYIRLDEQYVRELDVRFAALGDALAQHAVSYHLADETIMGKYGRVEDGDAPKFCVGKCSYNSVILPYCRSLSASTRALLKEFIEKGGHVYAYDALPAYTEGVADDYSFITEKLDEHYDDLFAAEALPLETRGEVQFAYREGANYKLLFVVNESSEEAAFTLPVGRFAVLDLNALTVTDAEESYVLPAGKSMLLLKDYCTLKRARRYADGQIDIAGEFVFEDGTDNGLALDAVSISYDGEAFDEPHNVYEVFERLVKADYTGELFVRYSFEVKDLPARVRLLCEDNDQKWFRLNGTEIVPEKSPFDIYFKELDITPYLHEGTNELVYQVYWHQAEGTRYALYDPEATESLRNCLAFDTEVEPIYLLGSFKVDADRAIIADNGIVDLADIPGSGYPHFCGSKTFAARIRAEKAHARLVLDGRYMVCGVRVNGVPCAGSVLDNVVPVTLNKGEENVIELTVTSSLRNMFGPHHMGLEPAGVSPVCFTMRGTWENGTSPDFHPDYNLVPFGLTGVGLQYEK